MTTPTCQDINAEYLCAALVWLRARLEQRAGQEQKRTSPSARVPSQCESLHRGIRRNRGLRGGDSSTVKPPLPVRQGPVGFVAPPAPVGGIEEALAKAAADLAAVESRSNPAPFLIQFSQLFGLSQFEREVLLFALPWSWTRASPRFAAAPRAIRTAVSDFRARVVTLRRARMGRALARAPAPLLAYDRDRPGGRPAADRQSSACGRTGRDCVKGLNYLDDRLSPLLSPVDLPGGEMPCLRHTKAPWKRSCST